MNVLPVRAYVILLALSAVTGGFLSYQGYVNRDRPGAKSFSVLALSLGVWALSEVVELVTSDVGVAVTARAARYMAIGVLPVALLIVALQYTGHQRRLTPTTVGFLLGVPALTWLFVVTNPLHHLVWDVRGMVRVGAYSTLVVADGPWYWVHVSYSYLLVAASTVLFVRAAVRSHETYRLQAILVVLGIAFPWAANGLYLFGPWDLRLDLTPVFFTVSGGFIGVAVLRYRFLDVVPVARDSVVEVMREGVVVLDDRGRIVDANPAAKRVFGPGSDELIGAAFEDVAPAELVEAIEDRSDETVTVARGRRERHFDLRVSRLDGGGSVILFRDVTEQREQAERLERQNERLDRFASVLSHDLRNPLNVAQGYVDLLETETDSELVGKVDRSLDRMEHIVEDALTLAREGRMVTDPEPVPLAEVARDAWNGVVTDGAELVVETDLTVQGDRDRVQRVFENLFRNAVEHAPTGRQAEGAVGNDGTETDAVGNDGGESAASVTVDDGVPTGDGGSGPTVVVGDLPNEQGFYVADDGPGIPEHERDRVFEFGFSSDDGSGLGLSIVSEIADAHGWNVTLAESDAGGARFEFRGVTPAPDRDG